MDKDEIFEQVTETPQIANLEVKGSGDPLQVGGLLRVIEHSYKDGIRFNDFELAVGIAIQEQLKESLDNLDSTTAQSVRSFLQDVDAALKYKYNRVINADNFNLPNEIIKTGKSMK